MSNETNQVDDREKAEQLAKELVGAQQSIFPLNEADADSSTNSADFLNRLIEAFHQANGLGKKEQVLGLLNSISQGCGQLAAYLAGAGQPGSAQQNPLPGLFFQFQELRRHFSTVTDEDILKSQQSMVGMYFIKEENVGPAIQAYAAEDVTVVPVEAVKRVDGSTLYVLRLIKHVVPEGRKSAFNIGQLLWYFDTSAIEQQSESDWNPFYEPTDVAANETYGEFGAQEFVGHGSDPVIVNNGFKEADSTVSYGRGESPVVQPIDELGYVDTSAGQPTVNPDFKQ